MNKYRILEILKGGRDNNNDIAGKICDRFLITLILINIIAVILESVPELGSKYSEFFVNFEIFSVTIFTIEYLLRLWTAGFDNDWGDITSLKRRIRYALSANGLIDLIAILPSLLPILFPNLDLRTLRILRLIRILKISNYSTALEDLYYSIYAERRALGAALYIFLLVVLFSSTITYMAENIAQPDKFSSIPQTLWWSVITLTTVGYGDVYPVTPLGQFIGSITAVLGVCTVALLTGIIAASFSNQAQKRKEEQNLVMFEKQLKAAFRDGSVSEDEELMLEELKNQLGIPDYKVAKMKRLIGIK